MTTVSSQRASVLERGEDRPQTSVRQLVEVDVIVEVAEPCGGVVGVDVPPQAVLLVPPPLAVGLRLGEQVVVEVGREPVAHLGIGVGVDGERIVVLPGGGLEHLADRADLVGMALAVTGLVDREPHHVVGIDQCDREEPRCVASRVGPSRAGPPARAGPSRAGPPRSSGGPVALRVLLQPVGRVGRDDRVEVHACSGPAHEVTVVPVPVGEAVGLHVRSG